MEGQRYLISILPSVYRKSWSQEESQEEPVFLLTVALPQHAADILTYWSFMKTGGKKTYFALICLKHHINYEILGWKHKMTLDKTRQNGDFGWDGTQVLRKSRRRIWVGPGKGEELGVKSLFSPQCCCTAFSLSLDLLIIQTLFPSTSCVMHLTVPKHTVR